MENMSDTKNEKVQQGDCNSLTMSDIDDDIIDVSTIDFSDHDTWLQPPSLDVAENNIPDLVSWLRTNTEQDCHNSHDNRRSIDTRTFTRPKKRSGRLNFESIAESSVPQSPNVWSQVSPSTRQEAKDEAECTKHESDSIPHMLKPLIPGVSGLCSTSSALTSGQESLEAFLNMSRSKGIDSFIDLAEPEFSDDIMDVSQPSVLYSSVMSVAMDDTLQTGNHSLTFNQTQSSKQSGIEDSQILTESMMQTSMFGDVVDVNFNDTFGKNNGDVTVLENTNYYTEMDATFLAPSETKSKNTISDSFNTATFNSGKIQSMDATFLAIPEAKSKDTMNDTFNTATFSRGKIQSMDATFLTKLEAKSKHTMNDTFSTATFSRGKVQSIDATYTPSRFSAILTDDPHASYIVNRDSSLTPDVKLSTVNDASYIVTPDIVDKTSFHARKDIAKDASFIITRMTTPEISENTTFRLSNPSNEQQNDTFNIHNFDATFEKLSPSKRSSINQKSEVTSTTNEPTVNDHLKASTGEKIDSDIDQRNADPLSQGESIENLSETFCKPAPKVHSKLNHPRSFLKHSNPQNMGQQNDTFNVQNFDATFEKIPVSLTKKNPINTTMNLSSCEKEEADKICKAPTFEKITASVDHQSVDPLSRGGSLDNLDSKFNKPAPKTHSSQLNPPRPLSKLPQSFQKSNPNLGSSSLKYANATKKRSAIPSFGFNRASARPSTIRNTESLQFTSKLLALGKMKSGSEQRLDVTRNVSELQIAGNGGSTESIDSTQSAHSAPDFDDRLSVRSDSSNNSYSMRAINIEEFQKIVRMREECLKQESTPKIDRRVLENNWVTTSNDLPSPILKNGPETYGSRGSSPRSTDSTVKTSSPLLSPSESLQNLPIDAVESNKDNADRNKLVIPQNKSVVPKKISQTSMKPPRNPSEPRTGLRPPASWTGTNRPASGIPRPASRIPGPRFIRPNAKINQGDTKK